MLNECFIVKTISYTTLEVTTMNRKTKKIDVTRMTIPGNFRKKTEEDLFDEFAKELNSSEVRVCDVVVIDSRKEKRRMKACDFIAASTICPSDEKDTETDTETE